MERLIEKLKRYIDAYQNPPFGREIEGTVELLQEVVDKLKEYADLKEQGLLLKLPCKVGDHIWNNDFGKLRSYEVTGFSFINLNQDKLEDVNVSNEIIIYYKNSNGSITGSFAVSRIGKAVFLTQAEAEEALEVAVK